MKRKKFIKRLMGEGISRNAAVAVADAANRAEIPRPEIARRVLSLRRFSTKEMQWYKPFPKIFDRILLDQAKRVPARIKPLRTKHLNGLRAQFVMVDEMDTLPPAERKRVLMGRWVGIGLANDPDLVAHHLGENVQVMTREEHAALHGGGGHE